MKAAKTGCFFIYSIILIILGMGIYKYRAEIIDFMKNKYDDAAVYAKEKASNAVNSVKDEVKEATD